MFCIYKRVIGSVEPLEYLAGPEGLGLGTAVCLAAGSLKACLPTQRPQYLVAGVRNEKGEYPAMPVLRTTVFETTADAAIPTSLVGSAVTLNAGANGVTASTEDGVFTLVETNEAAGGSVVKGYFA